KMNREAMRVGFAVHRDGLDADLAARADNAHGDLAAIRDQDLLDRRHDETCASQKRLPSGSAARATRIPYWSTGFATTSPPSRCTVAQAALMSSNSNLR